MVEVNNHPCCFRLQGAKFLDFSKFVDSLSNQRKNFIQYNIKFTTQRVKIAGETKYMPAWEWADLTNALAITPEVIETMKKFSRYISSENKAVMDKHKKALSGNSEGYTGEFVDAEYEVVKELSDDFDGDPNDEIPF